VEVEDPDFNKFIYSSLRSATDPAYCPHGVRSTPARPRKHVRMAGDLNCFEVWLGRSLEAGREKALVRDSALPSERP
jgi:hypothetical protein